MDEAADDESSPTRRGTIFTGGGGGEEEVGEEEEIIFLSLLQEVKVEMGGDGYGDCEGVVQFLSLSPSLLPLCFTVPKSCRHRVNAFQYCVHPHPLFES